jgi:hypothetical protein
MATEETSMEFIVWVETRLAGKTLSVEEVAKFARCASGISSEEIGFTLQEGKDVLKHVHGILFRLKSKSRVWRVVVVCTVRHAARQRHSHAAD